MNYSPTSLGDPDGYDTAPYGPEIDLSESGFRVIEKGIRKLVQTLWERGYKTVCSCGGHVKALEPYPWITIAIDLKDPKRPLEKLAEAVARFNKSLGKDNKLSEALDIWVLAPEITPAGFMIYLQPFDSNTNRFSKRISKLRKSANKMAFFIEKECGDIFNN